MHGATGTYSTGELKYKKACTNYTHAGMQHANICLHLHMEVHLCSRLTHSCSRPTDYASLLCRQSTLTKHTTLIQSTLIFSVHNFSDPFAESIAALKALKEQRADIAIQFTDTALQDL